jgi:hypothetical protein
LKFVKRRETAAMVGQVNRMDGTGILGMVL